MERYSFTDYQHSADTLRAEIGAFVPETAIVLGSGLGGLAEEVRDAVSVPYRQIPHFRPSTAPGHAGALVFGTLEGKPVAVMRGRLHHYEGYDFSEVTFPIRVLRLLGARRLLITNAAGCVNENWQAGELMLIRDHIKFSLDSPLCGPNLSQFGPRFPDSTYTYSQTLCESARQAAQQINIPLREGVYLYLPGPQYETPAEIRAARVLGADAVGMSTVPEVIVARHCGMEVLGISLLTNMAAGILDQPLTEEEVLTAAARGQEAFAGLIRACLRALPE